MNVIGKIEISTYFEIFQKILQFEIPMIHRNMTLF